MAASKPNPKVPTGDETLGPEETADNGAVPRGNLFDQPQLTALDPADPNERAEVERLLESLNDETD
jgi:hypothetical protein